MPNRYYGVRERSLIEVGLPMSGNVCVHTFKYMLAKRK